MARPVHVSPVGGDEGGKRKTGGERGGSERPAQGMRRLEAGGEGGRTGRVND